MIGYYAHSHGGGHCNYAKLFYEHNPMVIFTSRFKDVSHLSDIVRLPNEDLDDEALNPEDFPSPSYLHYAPVGMSKNQLRYQRILQAVIAHQIKLLIVDVSVEMAAFARVSGIPYAYIKMMGERNDKPHLYAYEGASFLVAYYPEEFESEHTPDWVKAKTLYLNFFSRYDYNTASKEMSLKSLSLNRDKSYITILKGFGGNKLSAEYLNVILEKFPHHQLLIVGNKKEYKKHPCIKYFGVVPTTYPFINVADFVIGACGANTTSEIAAVNKKFLITPEERPFREQWCMAEKLEEFSLGAIVDIDCPETFDKQNEVLGCWESYTCPEAPQIFNNWLKYRDYDISQLRKDVENYRTIQLIEQLISTPTEEKIVRMHKKKLMKRSSSNSA